MFKLVALLMLALVVTCFELQFATLASILNNGERLNSIPVNVSAVISQLEAQQVPATPPETTTTIRSSNPSNANQLTTTPESATTTTSTTKPKPVTMPDVHQASPTGAPSEPGATTSTTTTSTTTSSPASSPASAPTVTPATLSPPGPAAVPPTPPSSNQPGKPSAGNKPQAIRPDSASGKQSTELSILFYSVFIVYVSFVKLIYHNIQLINHKLTEQGILMVFGIIWQLVAREISSDYASFPRFNSRIFFYLFLPSTVLESASLLPNKWLFFNLLPILTHSIIGTLMYASSMGFTIYALARSHVFTQDWIGAPSENGLGELVKLPEPSTSQQSGAGSPADLVSFVDSSGAAEDLTGEPATNDPTLAECLIFGTILSSIDSAPMLTVFKQYRVNDKLYYLVLGENLMNNAVVITIFNSLLALFGTTKLTVFRVYLATLQFFANLVGAVFIGFALALVALISVRLTKRFQLPNVLLSYQNQCQAMVETLLIFKLAYLTYTLASLAGTSSIVGLVTFGILNDQYVKHNLNLRSQLAFRQVLLGMKTMGFSLVYPLLGMLLVDTFLSQHEILAASSQRPSLEGPSARSSSPSAAAAASSSSSAAAVPSSLLADRHRQATETRFVYLPPRPNSSSSVSPIYSAAAPQNWTIVSMMERDFVSAAVEQSNAATATPKRLTGQLAAATGGQSTFNWYVKFLSIVILLTIIYRFLIVISLGLVGNVLTCGQLKIKIKEQFLMAYGGFKGPLSMALMHSFTENDTQRGRSLRNKHLFRCTVLVNIFISAVLAGTLIRPLVVRIQTTLVGSHLVGPNPTIVFDKINCKLTEYLSHGLNSILGRSRSPYDRFIEFNETHIKPWLVRSGSNTNWLSVFYDNLILDETLNANCFHIAQEDPTTMRTARNVANRLHKRLHPATRDQRRPGDDRPAGGSGSRWRGMWGRRSSSVSILNTIDERPTTVIKTRPGHVESQPSGGGVSTISRGSSQFGASKRRTRIRSTRPQDQEALREFVMLNLKMENAKQRRRTQRDRFGVAPGHNEQAAVAAYRSDLSISSSGIPPTRASFAPNRFYGDVNDSSANLTDSSQDRLSRKVHLDALEARLGDRFSGMRVGQIGASQSKRRTLAANWHGTFDRGALDGA